MEAWIYVMIAVGMSVALSVGLALLDLTEPRGEERRFVRWRRARAVVLVAVGGGAAINAVPESQKRLTGRSGTRPAVARVA